MKENNKEEERSSYTSKNILNRIKTNKTEIFIELEDKNPTLQEGSSLRNDSQTSFTKALLNKVQKEEEEEFLKMKMKESQKLLNLIKLLSRKDYIVFFFVLISCGLNYNYLFLPFVLICITYYFAIEKLSTKMMKLKYFLEIFTVGYASYLFLYKVIIYSLIKNENKSILNDYKDYYIDFGICTLKDKDSYNYFFLNFIPELIIIAASGYGNLISFRCRLLKETDTLSKNINSAKLTSYIIIIYLFLVAFTNFYFSYLSLFYMLCIQFIMLLNSFKFSGRIIKKVLNYIMHFLYLIIGFQIILINYLNIYSIQKNVNEYYEKCKNKKGLRKYFTWAQIGINTDSSKEFIDISCKFGGYSFGIITLLLLKNTINILNKDINLEPNLNNEPIFKIHNKRLDAIKKVKQIFFKILSNIILFLSHPTFNFETTRILSITWTYFYRNLYSFGILIFIFLSFFSVHIKKNKCLVIYILTPMLIASLSTFHITNIKGIAEGFNEYEKLKYMRLAIGKYNYPIFEYWIGHLFFIIVMFLINSIYTAELKPKNIGSIKFNENKNPEIKNEEKIKKEEDKNDEEIKNEMSNEEKNIEKKNIEEKNDNGVEVDNDKNIENKNEDDKREIKYDTQHSINEYNDDSILIRNYEEAETIEINNEIKNENEKNKKKKKEDDKYLIIKQKKIMIKNDLNDEKKEISPKIIDLLIKGIFMHIDKITLIVMYLVSVYTVNFIHVILVFILIFQIITPGVLNGCYKMITLIFQLLYLFEFFIDLFKIEFNDTFNEHKSLLQFFFVYNKDKKSNDIEFFIYGVILCFYFQYRTCNINSIKKILRNKNISIGEYIKLKLKKYPKLQSIIFLLGKIALHLYLWALIFAFIFFNSYFEVNLFFGMKLIIFLLCCYNFINSIQSSENLEFNTLILLNRILLFLCCFHTLLVYLYQFLCKDFLKIKDKIKSNKTNFIIQNLPTLGFTIYEEDNLYYNFIPHFMTIFISVLYLWQSEGTIHSIIKNLNRKRSTMGKKMQDIIKKKNEDKKRMEKIKEEKNEFVQDKLYSDKYDENNNDLKKKSKNLLKANIFIFFSECYWLALFFAVGVIFSSYDLSISMLIYVIIFGTISIIMFYKIIIKLKNYIKNKSYFISKVIRFSIVEKPRNREINKKYRFITFKCLLFFSFLYFILIYFYGIFNLFQHGCNPKYYKGCDESHSEIFEIDSSDDIDHDNIEAKIKSYAFLFGIYFDIREENILNVAIAHLILTCLIIFDIYNQKLQDYYLNLSETLTSEIQKLVNENNVLQKYADVADLNILIQIGLSIAGINLNIQKEGEEKSRISLIDQFYEPPNENIDNKIIQNKKENLNKKDIDDDVDEPLQKDNPKENILECYDLNLNSEINSFLKNSKIQRFIEMIKKSNENEQQLSLSNSKDRIVRFIKKIVEELIIFISLCLALSKLNIYTFIYFLVTFILIATKKTMFKYYLLYIFIYIGIIVQSIFFLLNISDKTSPKTKDKTIFDVLNKTMSIPIYKEHFNLSEKKGFFYGLGINKPQVNLIWLEFMQIIIIYFYLNYFSYSIYQDIINLGSSSLSDQKFDFESLNMEEGSIEQIKTMTEYQYVQLQECLNCFNFHIGNNLTEFFQLLKINKTKYINYFDTKADNKLNLNFSKIDNPILKELIEFRMYEKEYLNKVEKGKKGKYKPLPRYLLILQAILYLYFHCFLLILIIMLSMMTAGVLSAIYFGICFYYLIKSDSIFLGQEYTYPKAIKTFLRIMVLIDIIIQGIYQLPFFSMNDDDLRLKIFRAIGLIKVVTINNDNDEISTIQQLEIFGKALIYFLMSLQNLIYNSKTFKRYYLVYLLENKFQTNKTSIVNAFTFNNNRVKVYQKSLNIRQRSVQAMDDLNKLIIELNSMNKMEEKLYNKSKYEIKQKPLEFICVREKLKDNDDNNSNNSNNNIDHEKHEYLEIDEIKEKIKSKLYDKFITKIYLWLHNYSANHKSVDKDAKNDFYIETIKGETKIKSIIETDLNRALSIIDLTEIGKNDMKDIELLIESQFDKEKKRFLELKRMREAKSKKNINKFRKFGNNLLKLNRFAKLLYGKFLGKTESNIKENKENLLELFRIQTEKERAERERKEKEFQKKQQKLRYIEELFDTKLFKKYLKESYQIRHIFLYLQSLFINHFTWICYFFMIIDHMANESAISLVYPLSIFCFALMEYPRPKKSYWTLCIVYTMIIMFIKFLIQLKIILLFITEKTYTNLVIKLHYYRIGFRYFPSTFSKGFIKYIMFDALVIFSILINRNLLITEGLWFKREEEIENIYEASERISIYKTKKYNNKFEAMHDLLLKYIYTPREVINIRKNLEKHSRSKSELDGLVKHKFPFFGKRNINPDYNEAKKTYFNRLFPRTRNEKPGNDFFVGYSLVMFLLCIYILIFYTEMERDKTYGSVNLDTTQFSGNMVIYLIFHIIILAYDRMIFISQNRENIEYDYIFYKRNEINEQGELISEIELNHLKSEISKNDEKAKFNKISAKEIERLKEKYNILFIQKEQFNKPLLNKYILHIITTILSHYMIFFYFPIKGNSNLGNEHYCDEDSKKSCNDFTSNKYLIFFYIIYLFYLILSALQIKYGFYDIKRKSLFKKKNDELLSSLNNYFQAIPFLNEIKNSIDWTFTSTCFNLMQWNKFESIYDTIFDTYCEKGDWDEKPVGKRISRKQKYSIGGSLALILILLLTVPLVLFSSLNPTNKLNNLTGAKINVDLFFIYKNGAIKKYNIFENTRADSISKIVIDDDNSIWEKYNYSKSIQTRNFNKDQVQRVIFSESSDRNWDLAMPHIQNLIYLLDLKNNNGLSSIQLNIGYEFTRPLPAEAQTCSDSFVVNIYSKGDNLNNSFIENLRTSLENCEDTNDIIDEVYSLPLRLTSGSEVNVIEDNTYFPKKGIKIGFQGCEKDNNGNINYFNSYFTVKSYYKGNENPLELHIFSDQISETTSGYSVLAFYITFILLAGSYIREFLANEPEKIMLEELPHPKTIIDLCEGIKIARYSYDFKNEEYLYTILIELMRSPDYLKLITDSSLDHFKLREETNKDN